MVGTSDGKKWSSLAEVQTGRLGLGLWVGCGAGAGYLSPIYMGSIPGIGQIFSSVSRNLSRADTGIAGGIGHTLGHFLGSLRLPGGMRVGTGCGVGIGYGIGVGVMLKPGVFKGILPDSITNPMRALGDGRKGISTSVDDGTGMPEFENRLRAMEARIAALERQSGMLGSQHDDDHISEERGNVE